MPVVHFHDGMMASCHGELSAVFIVTGLDSSITSMSSLKFTPPPRRDGAAYWAISDQATQLHRPQSHSGRNLHHSTDPALSSTYPTSHLIRPSRPRGNHLSSSAPNAISTRLRGCCGAMRWCLVRDLRCSFFLVDLAETRSQGFHPPHMRQPHNFWLRTVEGQK